MEEKELGGAGIATTERDESAELLQEIKKIMKYPVKTKKGINYKAMESYA